VHHISCILGGGVCWFVSIWQFHLDRNCDTLRITDTMYVCIKCSPGDVAVQFTAAPPTCPGDTFTFRCTVTGDMSGLTIWRVNGSSSLCILSHTSTSSTTCGPNNDFRAIPGTGFGSNTTFYSSTLSGTATLAMDGTLVECFGPANNVDSENRVGGSTLQILGQ